MPLKRTKLLQELHLWVDQKINQYQDMISDLRNSNTETKSSMGDKYETSRERLQQEIDQIQNQLNIFLQHKATLNQIKTTANEQIKWGSFIETTFGNILLVGSLGEIKLMNETYFGISEQSPLAKQLIGKKVGDQLLIQNKEHTILAIF